MTNTPALPFEFNPAIADGAVAIVFRTSGDIVLQHNAPDVVASGVVKGGPQGAGFVQALACLMMVSNEDLFHDAMRNAAAALYAAGGTPTSGKVN